MAPLSPAMAEMKAEAAAEAESDADAPTTSGDEKADAVSGGGGISSEQNLTAADLNMRKDLNAWQARHALLVLQTVPVS